MYVMVKRLWHRCFPVNFSKFLRKTFFTEHLRWLLLESHTLSTSIFATLIFHQKEIFPLSTSAGNIVKRLKERIKAFCAPEANAFRTICSLKPV